MWIGGLALALGGIFMVQFSIEAGSSAPACARSFGGLLAVALIAAGEWTRRREFSAAVPPERAHPEHPYRGRHHCRLRDPYAAYALYGFLSPAVAFILLGIVALATLGASLLHGPALAALGQVGASSADARRERRAELLGALHLSRRRHRGLFLACPRAVVALAGPHGGRIRRPWMLPGIGAPSMRSPRMRCIAVVGFTLAALLIVSGLFYGPDAEDGRIDPVSSSALAAYLFASAVLVLVRP